MTDATDPGADIANVLVSIVVVTWNGAHLLCECLAALNEQTFDPARYDIWVVDNASNDNTLELLAEHFPQVHVIRNSKNEGFAGGCNSALRRLSAPYAILVNNDAIADPGFVTELVNAAQLHPTAAALTAKVLLRPRFMLSKPEVAGALILANGQAVQVAIPDEDHSGAIDVVNSTGNEIRRDGNGQDRGWLTVDEGQSEPAEVFGFCGAAALLRMDAVREVGFFDDRFFLYYEDTDLSWRFRLRGWEVRYVASAVVRHAHASTTGEGSPLHRFYNDRNRMLTLIKCAPALFAVRAMTKTLAGIAVGIGHPRRAQSAIRIRAVASFLANFPAAIRQRRIIGNSARRTRREVVSLAVPPNDAMRYRT